MNPHRIHRALLAVALIFPAVSSVGSPLPPPLPLTDGWVLQDATTVASNGHALSTISTTNYRTIGWYRATVPGTVLTSLVNDGVYPEPLYGENNRTIPESLNKTDYWYRTQFSVPQSYSGKRVWLNLDGINYIADIWVNGKSLGSIRGAFARGKFDITGIAKAGNVSVLAVRVQPQPHPGVPNDKHIGKGAHNGGLTALDGPTFLCSIGWDWIPGIRDRDTGIWRGVSLSATGPVTISNTNVVSDLAMPKMQSADLTLETTLTNHTREFASGDLVGRFGGIKFDEPIIMQPGEQKKLTFTRAQIAALHVVHPKLWWPNGYGPQNLYTMHLEYIPAGSPLPITKMPGYKELLKPHHVSLREATRPHNAQHTSAGLVSTSVAYLPPGTSVSDSSDTDFGIRKITYSVPGSDNLTLSVNGVPILCKGGDWGMDEALKRITSKRIDAEVRMHKLANYTMIRNWVGQSTSDELYRACDKYGVLLWDEFFQPNPSDGPNPIETTTYLNNVREKILRYRSHPSIALWCARNEGNPPPVIDSGIKTLMAELDPVRLYQPSSTSGRGVNSGGPYFWRAPREYYNFNEAFKTEIGSVSIPTLESIQGMMPEKDWNQINEDWAEHDLTAGASGGDWYPQTLANRYGPISSLADFARKGQMANYEAFRAMYEGRNAKLFHPSTGVITWMSNPAQPSFVWQLYSWDLEPNASLFGVEKACEPIHIQMNQNNWHVMVINNTPNALSGCMAVVSVYNIDGSRPYFHEFPVAPAASAATDVALIDFPEKVSNVHFVRLNLYDAASREISNNTYWRETKQDDFTALNSLPAATVIGRVTQTRTGGTTKLTVAVNNQGDTPALMVHLQLRDARTNKRVLPVFYSDNYFSVMGHETKSVEIEADTADLHGDTPVVMVDGWNVDAKSAPMFVTNTGAAVHPMMDVRTPLALNVRINAGGSASGYFTFGRAASTGDGYTADQYFVGGSVSVVTDTISTPLPNSAPAIVYQSERWGAATYTIPVQTNRTYTVRLHFSENTYNDTGKRLFNVDINVKRVLTNLDIFAEAGGKFKALVRDVPNVVPDQNGNIVINFTRGAADEPKISAIEVLANP